MTTLGKILVTVNLLFAVLVSALIIMVFATRTNWAGEYGKLKVRAEGERARYDSMRAAKDELEKDKNVELAKSNNDREDLAKQVKSADMAKREAIQKREEAENRVETLELAVKQQTAVSEGLKVENAALDKRLNEAIAKVQELGLSNKSYKAEAIKATTDLQTSKDRNEQLLVQLVEMNRKIQFLEGNAPAGARAEKNPPPDDIHGRVMMTDASGYITINLGSDSGVNKGNTMEIFRLKPRPTYIGTLRIMDVRPHEAVGKLIDQRGARVEKDDEVASRILGTK